jgi:hypothetical protein
VTLDSNALGQRGENAVAAQLLRPIQADGTVPEEPFIVESFGGKHELFDAIVYLKDHAGALTGAHFFIQIKTSAPAGDTTTCPARFEKNEVETAIAFRAPVYLIGVEARTKEMCFVTGISHSRTKGIARITKARRKLSSLRVKRRIYNEVRAFHATLPSTFESLL